MSKLSRAASNTAGEASSPVARTVRMTVDVPADTHRALKIAAAQRDVSMQDVLRPLIAAWADEDPRAVGIVDGATEDA